MSVPGRQNHIERARLLLRQKRYSDAEQHAAAVLQGNPRDAEALQIIGHCRLDKGNLAEAINLFEQCIGIEPGDDYVHYLLAFACYRHKQKDKAMQMLSQAISLNPYASGYYALYAYILLDQRQYQQALEKANLGLQVNAQDLACLNARSQALFRLKSNDAAYNTIREALTVDPEDDFTHTNFGWHFMETGRHKLAKQHFRQALRINPANNAARHGYKESLKANLPPYRWMLMFSMWLARKSKKARWAVVIIIMVGFQLVSKASEAAGYKTVGYVLIGLYMVFVVFSWVGTSIANAMLLLSREGKYVLTASEKYISAGIIFCLLATLLLVCAGQYLPHIKPGNQFFAALIFLTLTLPVSRFEYWDFIKKRRFGAIYTIALSIAALVAIGAVLIIHSNSTAEAITLTYVLCVAAYTWLFGLTGS